GDEVESRTEAADRDLRTFAIAALDADARNTLERFRQVGVGELADIFRRDRVDDARRIALDIHRALEAGANAGHDDDVLLRVRHILGGSGACQYRGSDGRNARDEGRAKHPLAA